MPPGERLAAGEVGLCAPRPLVARSALAARPHSGVSAWDRKRSMKTVTNKTKKPLKIRLPGGKTLFLGATRRAQIRDDALEHPPVKKLLEAGEIEVTDDAGVKHSSGLGAGLSEGQTHGAARAKVNTGDR